MKSLLSHFLLQDENPTHHGGSSSSTSQTPHTSLTFHHHDSSNIPSTMRNHHKTSFSSVAAAMKLPGILNVGATHKQLMIAFNCHPKFGKPHKMFHEWSGIFERQDGMGESHNGDVLYMREQPVTIPGKPCRASYIGFKFFKFVLELKVSGFGFRLYDQRRGQWHGEFRELEGRRRELERGS